MGDSVGSNVDWCTDSFIRKGPGENHFPSRNLLIGGVRSQRWVYVVLGRKRRNNEGREVLRMSGHRLLGDAARKKIGQKGGERGRRGYGEKSHPRGWVPGGGETGRRKDYEFLSSGNTESGGRRGGSAQKGKRN